MILRYTFPQIVVQPNLIIKGVNENDYVAFKCANHQSKSVPETMMHTQLTNTQ